MAKKRKRVESGLKEYLEEVAEALPTGEGAADAADAALHAVARSRGSAPAVMGDARMSRQVERLLHRASASGTAELAGALGGDGFVRAAKSPWGSYAIGSLCSAIQRCLASGQLSAERARSLLLPFAHSSASSAPALSLSKPGSHALRSLLALLASDSALTDALHAFTVHALSSLTDRQNPPVFSIACSTTGSAFLQALVRAHARCNDPRSCDATLAALMRAVFADGHHHPPDNTASSSFTGSMRRRAWMQLSKHLSGSHFVQELLNACSSSLAASIYDGVFYKRLSRLAMHRQANHPVQSLVRKISLHKLGAILHELRNELGLLAKNNRSGVLSALLQRAHGNGSLHEHASVLLFGQLKQWSEEPLRLLLFPPEMEGSCAPQGCKTLSELGSGTDCERKRWWLRAANLRADELSALACSSSGSEVLEKIITSDLDAAKRHAIFDGLLPSCVAIAATPPGSYLLERASRAVDVQSVENLAASLSSELSRLMKSTSGAMLTSKLDVQGYVKQPQSWRKETTAKANRRQAFAEILGNAALPSRKRTARTRL